MYGSSLLRFYFKTQKSSKLRYFTNNDACFSNKKSNQLGINLSTSSVFKVQTESKGDDTPEILDICKERLKYSPLLEEQELEEDDPFGGLVLTHGIFGVFDIEDLVQTLQHQQAEDIFVASVPKEITYVNYIVVVSGRSERHMQAIAQFVRRVFKHKRYSTDSIPKIEGENSSDWMALDLSNIALHIFSRKARLIYDLDSLWAVGRKYDDECNKKEPVSSLLENYSFSLKGLEPAE